MSFSRFDRLSQKGFSESKSSDSVYENDLWPQINRPLDLILQSDPSSPTRISFEEAYSAVYKIVCQGYGIVLYEDLVHKKIEQHIDSLDAPLQLLKDKNVKEYIERFNESLQIFIQRIQSVLAVFTYLSRMVNAELPTTVYKIFCDRFVNKHIHLVLEHLKEAEKESFTVEPSTFASIIKSLYAINQEYADLNPDLFRKFIPGYKCDTEVSQLPELSQEAREMSDMLQNTIPVEQRCCTKRPVEEEEDQMCMDDS